MENTLRGTILEKINEKISESEMLVEDSEILADTLPDEEIDMLILWCEGMAEFVIKQVAEQVKSVMDSVKKQGGGLG